MLPDIRPAIDAIPWPLDLSDPPRVVTRPRGSDSAAIAALGRDGDRRAVLEAVRGWHETPTARRRAVALRVLRHVAARVDAGPPIADLPGLLATLRPAVCAEPSDG